MGPFKVVEAELLERSRAAFDAGDADQALLWDRCASYLRGVELATAPTRDRAEGSIALLYAALGAHAKAMAAHTGRTEGEFREALTASRRHLEDVTAAVVHLQWAVAAAWVSGDTDSEVIRSAAEEVSGAGAVLAGWARLLAAAAADQDGEVC